MTRVAVIAHFLSANIGDRYQGTGLADRLASALPGSIVDRINSHSFDIDAEVATIFDVTPEPFDVFNPDRIDYATYDFVILPTGSLAGDVTFVQISLKLLESARLKRLFIWGGFHDILYPSGVNDGDGGLLNRIFVDRRVLFYARGWLELALYSMLAAGGRGVCGGDPILLNEFSSSRSCALPSKTEATYVMNGHMLDPMRHEESILLAEIAAAFPRICSVEGAEDGRINLQVGEKRVTHANTIATYAAIAQSSSIIVTSRLHGIAFAKAVSPCLPVIVCLPKREPWSHIKFRSVAESAAGFGRGIAHLWENFSVDDALSIIKSPDSYLRREHEINFAHYMDMTEQTFRAIVKQITEV